MGGYRALTYLSRASEDIPTKVKGVLAVEPPDNLSELAKETSAKDLKDTLDKVLAEDKPEKVSIQEILQPMSSKPNILIISATNDTVVPTIMQARLASYFQEKGFPTKVIEVPGNHRIPRAYYVSQALQYLTGKLE